MSNAHEKLEAFLSLTPRQKVLRVTAALITSLLVLIAYTAFVGVICIKYGEATQMKKCSRNIICGNK